MLHTRRVHRYLFLLLTAVLLTSCSRGINRQTNSDRSAGAGNDQKGYLHSDADAVMFIHWTDINGKLNGQMNIFYAKGVRGCLHRMDFIRVD